MSLIKFNRRFPLFDQMFPEILDTDRLFNEDLILKDNWMPAINVKENETDFEIEVAAPGFSKKDFKVTIDDNILNVWGEKQKEDIEKDEDYTRKEFSYNSFKRSLKLPNIVNADQNVKAVYKNGVLKLNLLKKEEVKEQPKKVIEVL